MFMVSFLWETSWRVGTLWVVLFCVVDALNTLGKVPAVHIKICNNTTGARE